MYNYSSENTLEKHQTSKLV